MILAGFLISSCSPEKNKMLSAYEPLFEAYCAGNFEAVYALLDQESQTMIQRLVDNESTDSLIQIATEYGVPNLAVVKHVYFPTDPNNPDLKYDFMPFLGYLGVSFMNVVERYDLYSERSRVGDENFLTLQKIVAGGYRHVEWLKYTLEEDQYKLNLVYVLQMAEPFFRELVYDDINRIEVVTGFKYADLYKNTPNYRDLNFAKRFVVENCGKTYDLN